MGYRADKDDATLSEAVATLGDRQAIAGPEVAAIADWYQRLGQSALAEALRLAIPAD